jgi:hypothetical protein
MVYVIEMNTTSKANRLMFIYSDFGISGKSYGTQYSLKMGGGREIFLQDPCICCSECAPGSIDSPTLPAHALYSHVIAYDTIRGIS